MKKLLASAALSLALLYGNNSYASHHASHIMDGRHDENDRALVLAGNAGLGALTGCIGAEISGYGCLEGLWRGLIGGSVAYLGIEIGSNNANIPFTGELGRLVNDLGASIVSNAAYSRDFLGRYETSLGPLLFRVDNKDGFDAYILPMAAVGILYNIVAGNGLDLIGSLEDGTVSFIMDDSIGWSDGLAYNGFTISTIPTYVDSNGVRSHENIHTYQISKFSWTDDLMPEVWRLKYGAEILKGMLALPSNIFEGYVYYYNPFELEAYTMERR